jgi:GPH family glycoside/pentoside/hexuronide:cation symporter
VAYALPAVPLAALTLPLYVLVPTFYTETLGLSLASVGLRSCSSGSSMRSTIR